MHCAVMVSWHGKSHLDIIITFLSFSLLLFFTPLSQLTNSHTHTHTHKHPLFSFFRYYYHSTRSTPFSPPMKAWQFLPSFWNSFALPTNIQKRLYKFLLRKAIGQFLAKELDLDNFDIELYNGSVELRDLDLNLEVSMEDRQGGC